MCPAPARRCILAATVFVAGLGIGDFGTPVLDRSLVATAKADDDGGGDGGGGGGGGGSGGADGGGSGADNDRFRAGRQTRMTSPFGLFRLGWPFQQQRSGRVARARSSRAATATPATTAPRELVIAETSDAERDAITMAGFRVLGERSLSDGRGLLLRIAPPARLSRSRALARLRELAPGRLVDRNRLYAHRFRIQGGRTASRISFPDPLAMVAWSSSRGCGDFGPIGVVDTAVDTDHPAFHDKRLDASVLRSPDRAPSGKRHGTAIATLLLGDGVFPGIAPQARVIAIDAFHSRAGQDQIDTFDLVAAMDALQRRDVAVINLSLAGDANAVLDSEGRRARARGIIVVAAGGNDGAAAKPRYPAAYDWAVAVTAIDGRREVYRQAARGPHIRFAAPGVNLELRDARERARLHTGTSFAVPFVTARIALTKGASAAPPGVGRVEPVDKPKASRDNAAVLGPLVAQAIDLGAVGRDAVYGDGLVQFGDACSSNPAP